MNKHYLSFIQELKQNIVHSRYMAARLANREQILLYLRIGQMLQQKVENEKWGGQVIEKIATDLQNELPGIKGFSHRNLWKMKQFYCDYQSIIILPPLVAELHSSKKKPVKSISQTVSAKLDGNSNPLILPPAVAEFEMLLNIGFSLHILIMNKCHELPERLFYINKTAENFWSKRTLEHHLNSDLYRNQGTLVNNFSNALPKEIGANALKLFQDEYLFDFINLDEDANEKVFETEIVGNIKNAIMALGQGFTFVGNQYRLEVGGQEFFIDLLFYNRILQCLVVFELKKAAFKPEHAGQLNFYLNVLDEKVKLPHENPSIGIVLCKDKNNTVVEFAFKNIEKGMGAATFKTARQVPKEMKGILPEAKDLADLL